MTAPLGVVIADDHALFRTGIRLLLEAEPDLRVVGEAADGDEVVALAAATGPDVVLLDLSMPGDGGPAVVRRLLAGQPAPRVLVVTTFDDDHLVHESLAAGASGYLLKSAPPEQLPAAIRAVAAGGSALSRDVLDRLLVARRRGPDPAAAAALRLLSTRERAVLAEVAAGRSDTETARRLGLTVGTVKTYVHRALRKLGVDTRIQAVALVLRAED